MRKTIPSILLSLLCFLIICLNALSQGAPPPHGSLLNFTPQAPNAASLGKFGDVPVSYYTGIPNISIPIYSYQNRSNGLHLNIALDYHGGGIRVQEKASNIGIGWSLSSGGIITRELRGSGPDEGVAGCTGYWVGPALPSIGDYRVNENMYGTTTDPNNPYWRYNQGTEDAEPDVFSFQFAGKTGKFIVGKNGDARVYPLQKTKIQKIQNGTENSAIKLTFILTAEDGIKYYFDKQENISTYSQSGVVIYFGNSWYLSKIEAPFATGQIDFNYDDVAYNYTSAGSQVYYKNLPGSNGDRQSTVISNTTIRGFYAKRLKQINFQNGVGINLFYDPVNRCDISGDNALKRIEISDGHTTYGFRLKQSYSFTYNGIENNSCVGLTQQAARLVLHEVIEYAGSAEKPPYRISYKTNNATSLPDVMSNAQDHWGFFNGAYNNSALLPFDGLPYYSSGSSGSIDNADRRTNPTYAQEGIISKLSYPTGGFSEFTFESNEVPVGTNASYNFQNAHVGINGFDQTMSTVFDLVKPIAFSTTQFQFEFGGFSPANSNCSIRAKITSVDGSMTYTQQILGPGTGYLKRAMLTLPPGQYRYSYTFEPGQPCTSELFVVSLDWQNIIQLSPSSSEYAGGLRIQKIVENDGGNSINIKTRTYEYNMENSSLSSGYLAVRPEYSYGFLDNCYSSGMCAIGGPSGCQGKQGSYNVITSSPLFTLSNSLGSPVLYSRVVEKFTGSGSGFNGKITRTFTLGPNQILPSDATLPDFFNMPYVTPQVPSWAQGQPLIEEVTDVNNQLVSRVKYDYEMAFSSIENAVRHHFKGIKVYKSQTRWINGGCIDYNRFLLNEYFPFSGLTQLAKTTKTEFVNGVAALTTTSEYTYDPNFYGLTKIKTKESNGKVVEQRMYYPYNYAATGIHHDMVNENLIAPVISKEIWKHDHLSIKMVGAEITEFGKYNNLIIRPTKLYRLESKHPLEVSAIGNFDAVSLIRNTTYLKPKHEMNHYDSRANLLEQRRMHDTKVSYIWGYNQTYTVAEIVGKSYSDAVSESGINLSIINNPTTSDVIMRLELDKLRALLGCLVTTYTYKPLVGMTSQTDPNGRTTYYQYDAFGRLVLVRDHNNNILKKICYNYAGQQENCSINTTPNWRASGNYRCVLDGNGQYTGYQEREERDLNANSTTYNQLQWVSNGYNPSDCPPPSTCEFWSCSAQGEGYACIYGQCEQGYRVNTGSYYDYWTDMYVCVYHYEFSDGSWSQNYNEYSYWPCY